MKMNNIGYTVVEEFLKNNPDFNVYQVNEQQNLERVSTVAKTDWEDLDNPCLVDFDQASIITIGDLVKNNDEVTIYRLVK